MRIKLLFIILFLIINTIHANPICQVKGGGVFDNLILQFANIGTKWQNEISPLARKFFFILFGMEFMWQLTVKRVFAGDIEKLWVFFFTRAALCFFFAKYLVDIELYKGMISYMVGLGSRLSGFSLNISTNAPFTTLGPSAILGYYSCIAEMVQMVTDQSSSLGDLTSKMTLAIVQVIVFVVLIFIAFYISMVILQAYALIYIGFIFAGFAGSSWTWDYWQRYFGAIISIGVKFMAVCFLMGVFQVQMQSWATDIASVKNIADASAIITRICGTSLFVALALFKLPEWLAAKLSGQVMAGIPNISQYVSLNSRGTHESINQVKLSSSFQNVNKQGYTRNNSNQNR
jgi:P-type conjugative transfer protein TrbL